jgi:methyl-accepting chemotaxis protein
MEILKTLVINNIIVLIISVIFVICFVKYYVKKNTNDSNYININDSINIDNIVKHLILLNPTISKYYKDKKSLTSDDKNAILTSYILESNPLLSDYVLLSNQHFIDYTLKTDKNISDYIIQNKANMDILKDLINEYISKNDKKLINTVITDVNNTLQEYINKNDEKISKFITQNGIKIDSIDTYFRTNDTNIQNINNLINNYILKNTDNFNQINLSISNINTSINDINNNIASYIAAPLEL